MKRVAPALDPLDVVACLGVLIVTIGVGMVFVPAALVVLGSLLLVYAILASRSAPPATAPVKETTP